MANILIIEDSLLMRETLRQMLELDGYEVLEAEDGPTGIALARPDNFGYYDALHVGHAGTQISAERPLAEKYAGTGAVGGQSARSGTRCAGTESPRLSLKACRPHNPAPTD